LFNSWLGRGSRLVQQLAGKGGFADVVQERGELEFAQGSALEAKLMRDGHGKRGGAPGVGFDRPVVAKARCRERAQGRHETLLDLPAPTLGLTLPAAEVAQHARLRIGEQPHHGYQDEQGAVVDA